MIGTTMSTPGSHEELPSRRPSPSVPETVTLAVAVALLGVLGYQVAPVLSPFVLIGGIVYLLYPLRHSQLPGRLLWLSLALFALWFLYSILGLLAPFIISFIIAYLLNPLVSRLEQRRVPRWLSSLMAVLLIIAGVVVALLFILPPAIQQFNSMISGLGGLAREFSAMLQSGSAFDLLEQYGIPVDRARQMIAEQLSPRLENVLSTLLEGVLGFVTGISSIILHVINAVIIPFLTFYLLMDYPLLTNRFLRFFPPGRRDRVAETGRAVDRVMGRYLRGAIAVALIQGTLSALVLWFIGVRYPLVLGIMTALLNFIPYLGLVTSLVVASIVAMLSGEPMLARVGGVVILYLSQKLLEATILGPKIIGAQVGLHPVLLILCLLVFGYFLGFVGLLIAVPLTALLVAGLHEWEERHARAPSATPEK